MLSELWKFHRLDSVGFLKRTALTAPALAPLVLATNRNFYGTTGGGGTNNGGTVFKITAGGKLTTLYIFCSQTNCTNGSGPSGLLKATNGNFYGTTYAGGANSCGTVFEITPVGKLTTLYSFCSQTNCTDGDSPYAGLLQGTDGNFYGTTSGVPAGPGTGTVFEITAGGKLTTLHN